MSLEPPIRLHGPMDEHSQQTTLDVGSFECSLIKFVAQPAEWSRVPEKNLNGELLSNPVGHDPARAGA
jgi:hypothetical protein